MLLNLSRGGIPRKVSAFIVAILLSTGLIKSFVQTTAESEITKYK